MRFRVLQIPVVAALLVAGAAGATTINGLGGASITYVTGGAVIADGSGLRFEGRTFDIPSPRTVGVVEPHTLRLGGSDINVNARRNLLPAVVNKSAGLLLKGLPVVGTGLLIWDLYDTVRVRPDGSGGLKLDAGTDEVPSGTDTQYSDVGNSATCRRAAPTDAAACLGSAASAGRSIRTVSCDQVDSQDVNNRWYRNCTYTVWLTPGGPSWLGPYNITVYRHQSTIMACPASIDASNPANSIPAGLPPGPDGKCRTGRYNVPLSPQQAGERLETYAPPTGEKLKEIVQDILDRGGQIVDAPSRSLSGPASKPGQPVTTTTEGPSGTTTKTVTPTTHYTYNGSSITYNITNVTVTNHAEGGTTTETEEKPKEEETSPPADPDMPALPELYERKYPDGLQGVWNARKAELEASPIFSFLAGLVPSFGDGGCPVWALPVDVLGISHAGTQATVPCYVWAFVRLVMIITALLLCRRLIFGG